MAGAPSPRLHPRPAGSSPWLLRTGEFPRVSPRHKPPTMNPAQNRHQDVPREVAGSHHWSFIERSWAVTAKRAQEAEAPRPAVRRLWNLTPGPSHPGDVVGRILKSSVMWGVPPSLLPPVSLPADTSRARSSLRVGVPPDTKI